MKNLAPKITRKRLLIEGFYEIFLKKITIKNFFLKLSKSLNLRVYGKPIIFVPKGLGKIENQGYDAFIPLIDSGISLYVWVNEKFLSCVIYTCKDFNEKKALSITKSYFKMKKIAFKQF